VSPQEARQAWVAALRSGEYAQTTAVLTRLSYGGEVVGHCCLGVACEVAVKAGLDVDIHDEESVRIYDDADAYLPDSVKAWLGINDDYYQGCLVAANDIDLESFAMIADGIEACRWGDDE